MTRFWDGQTDGVTALLDLLSPSATQVKSMSDHVKYFPALYVCDCYLCLVFAASAFKCLVAEVGYGNETTEITHVDSIWVRGLKQPLPQELGSSMGNLTISLHLTKT